MPVVLRDRVSRVQSINHIKKTFVQTFVYFKLLYAYFSSIFILWVHFLSSSFVILGYYNFYFYNYYFPYYSYGSYYFYYDYSYYGKLNTFNYCICIPVFLLRLHTVKLNL